MLSLLPKCLEIDCLCMIMANLIFVLQDNFEFKKPSMPASRCRARSTGGAKDAFACRPNSAPALMV